jgi:hypothetical protein
MIIKLGRKPQAVLFAARDREYARDLDELNEDVPTGSIKLLNAGLLKAEEIAKSFALFPTYRLSYIYSPASPGPREDGFSE